MDSTALFSSSAAKIVWNKYSPKSKNVTDQSDIFFYALEYKPSSDPANCSWQMKSAVCKPEEKSIGISLFCIDCNYSQA